MKLESCILSANSSTCVQNPSLSYPNTLINSMPSKLSTLLYLMNWLDLSAFQLAQVSTRLLKTKPCPPTCVLPSPHPSSSLLPPKANARQKKAYTHCPHFFNTLLEIPCHLSHQKTLVTMSQWTPLTSCFSLRSLVHLYSEMHSSRGFQDMSSWFPGYLLGSSFSV